MKKFIYLFSAVLLGLFVLSCSKEDKKPTIPIQSISVTCQNETVKGVVDDAAKKVTFTFSNAENFSSANIVIEVSDGWTLTYPKTLTGVDLQSTPVLNFTDPNNAVVKYTIAFSSNAFPIIDASKIQIEGLNAGENVSVDNGTKTITVKYDQDKMNYNSVKLIFNTGALQTGTVTPADLDFDFADGVEQPIVFQLGGDRTYTLKLDVSAYAGKSVSEMGFTDASSTYLDATKYPYVHVYVANQFLGIPVFNTNTFWCPSNPRDWEYKEDHSDGSHYAFLNDAFLFPGDWTSDRPTMNSFGKLVVIYLDQDKVKGGITSNIDYAKTLGDMNNLVVVTGCKHSHSINYMVLSKNTFTNLPTDVPYRGSLGFADGKLSFATAAARGGKLYEVPFQTDWNADAQATADAATTEWKVSDAAWVYGWAIRDGKALKITDIVKNDGSQYISDGGVLGLGWNGFYSKRVIVGRTYDNKIAIMVSAGGQDLWDGSFDNAPTKDWADRTGGIAKGYSTQQMIWIAKQLGWRDAALIATGDDEKESSLDPNVKVNGTAVVTQDEATYNPAWYANNGATQKGSYFLTFDAK
jgi:hypothetical protein